MAQSCRPISKLGIMRAIKVIARVTLSFLGAYLIAVTLVAIISALTGHSMWFLYHAFLIIAGFWLYWLLGRTRVFANHPESKT
jgi:hypothetical protein